METTNRVRRRAALALALVAAVGLSAPAAPGAHAQALAFEPVGNEPIDAYDLAFDGEGALWAAASRVYRLPPGGSAWEEAADPVGAYTYLLPLGPDTLLIGAHSIRRSLDGGQTWAEVHDDGDVLFEAPTSGILLAGRGLGTGVLYSHDRGASWAEGFIDAGGWSPDARAFAELPPGHPHAGRLLAACLAGMSYSDDDGRTWEKSSLWTDGGRYSAYGVAVGVDGAAYAAFYEVGVEGLQVARSTDGGQTWAVAHQFGEYRGVRARIFALPGGANPEVGVVMVVEHGGQVSRSDDGGASWLQVGRVPSSYADPRSVMRDAAVGPDGRLYVAGGANGPADEWVFRTVDPAVSAAVKTEAEPLGGPVEIGPGGGSFAFRVRLTNQTTQPLAFEGWSAVAGPVDREPVVGPQSVTLMPGQQLVRTVTQQVPGRAPAGEYTYTVRAGDLGGGEVLSEASFAFEKVAGATPQGGIEDWSVSGWDSEDAGESVAPGLTLAVSPNPSQGAASVVLTLGGPAEAAVSVYDVLGRRVAVLHAGPLAAGRHAFALAGSDLPPGVYVVRAAAGGVAASQSVTLLR